MNIRNLLLSLSLFGLLTGQVSQAEEKPEPVRMLFVTQTAQGAFLHGPVNRQKENLSPAEIAIVQLGEKTGLFRADCTQDCEADFTKENLQNYKIIGLYTCGVLPIAEEDLDYFFNDWLKQPGNGVIGFHSAADTYKEYEPYWDMIGGSFLSHPWFSDSTVTLKNVDVGNPISEPFGKEFVIQDEIYMYRNWQPEKVRVLLSLNYSKSPAKIPVPVEHGYHVPVCWIKEYGQGRVFYSNLGHNEVTWTNPVMLESITQAVRWIRGDIEAEASPNPEVSAAEETQAQEDFKKFGFQIQKSK